jgi:CheY-like chemotaxis protein
MDNKARILIVDDEPTSRSFFNYVLNNEKFDAVTVDSGSSALEILEKDPHFDLILLDNLMVGLDGIETLKLLKSNEKTRNIKVLMTSGLDDPEEISKAMTAGASGFISKPISIDELIDQIRSIIPQ